MNQTETTTTHEDPESKLAFAQTELDRLRATARQLDNDAEAKAKTFEREPTPDAFTAVRVADQLAKNAHKAAQEYEEGVLVDLRAAVIKVHGARRYAELHPRMDVRTMLAPHTDRLHTLITQFAQQLDAEIVALSKTLSERNGLVNEANDLAIKHGGQPAHFSYAGLPLQRALADYVQPELVKTLGAIGRGGIDMNRGCLLAYSEPHGKSQAMVELQLRLDQSRLPESSVFAGGH